MALIVKNEPLTRIKPTPGMTDAVCVFVVDIGIHESHGKFPKKSHQVLFCWEIAENIPTGEYAGKPFMVSQRYTFTLYEKGNLSKMLEGWLSKKISDETRATGFDLDSLVGQRCTINLVESSDEQYVNVGAVLPANKANQLVPVCTSIPAWIQKLIDTQLKEETEKDLPF